VRGRGLGALCEVLARLGRGGAVVAVGAVQPHGGAAGKGVKRDEHASGEEEMEAVGGVPVAS